MAGSNLVAPRLDHGAVGNGRVLALIAPNSAVEWLCLPHWDSGSVFGSLLDDERGGTWRIDAHDGPRTGVLQYLRNTNVLRGVFGDGDASWEVVDFAPRIPAGLDVTAPYELIRLVRPLRGTPRIRIHFDPRPDYGRAQVALSPTDDGVELVGGPVRLRLATNAPAPYLLNGQPFALQEPIWQVLSLTARRERPDFASVQRSLELTIAGWRAWARSCALSAFRPEHVLRSALCLKLHAHHDTGAIIAATTTSIPEAMGTQRTWDYRFCWLRDATFTLYALLTAGYTDEARAWREWLLRAAAGTPAQLSIMYGIMGNRDLAERTLGHLAGYENSRPVRIGNGAHGQRQMDVYGEVMDSFHVARRHAIEPHDDGWRVQTVLMDFLESNWDEPDSGIWEVRGPPRHFTHSKVMAWVAVDRAIRAVEESGMKGPVARWRRLRDSIHAEVCARGFDSGRNAFMQYYGAPGTDASLLMIPLVGFLPARDPRMRGTLALIERELMQDGLVLRYRTEPAVDGLPPGEGAFLACSFWYADNLALAGELDRARETFWRLAGLANDLGLLAEEYDSAARRQLGNFPQAFSHVALVNTAFNCWARHGVASERGEQGAAAEA